MRIALVLGVLPVLLSLPLVHAQNEVERVGRYGDPNLLRFVGAESFPAGEIRRALLGHVDFLSAHHPGRQTTLVGRWISTNP